MQPTLLHLLSDQRLAERQAARRSAGRRPRRHRGHLPEHFRQALGGRLITLGTRLAGSGATAAVLHRRPSA